MEPERIGEAIREARERRGLTQAQLAAQLPSEVHPKTIGRWERGQAAPRAGQLAGIEAVLGSLANGGDGEDVGVSATAAEMTDAELIGALMTFVAEAGRRLIVPPAAVPTVGAS